MVAPFDWMNSCRVLPLRHTPRMVSRVSGKRSVFKLAEAEITDFENFGTERYEEYGKAVQEKPARVRRLACHDSGR